MSIKTTVKYETIEGSATANDDFVPVDETFTFEPKEDRKTVTVIIIDDDEWEPDETFFVRLSLPDDSDAANGVGCKLGKKKIAQVTGSVEFCEKKIIFCFFAFFFSFLHSNTPCFP